MIAIMTWKEELNEELKLRLDNNRVIDSIEELEDNMDYLDKVILSKHSEWTIDELKTVLKNLMDSGIEIFYIKEFDTPEEFSLLIEMDVKNILFNPKDVEEIVNKVENTRLFDDEDYSNGATFIPEIDETEEEKEESKEEKDIIKIENTVDVEKIVKQAVESVQPVVDVRRESVFKLLLNFILEVLKLFAGLLRTSINTIGFVISEFAGIILWLIGGAIVTLAANYFLNGQGINSIPELIDVAKEIIQQFTK